MVRPAGGDADLERLPLLGVEPHPVRGDGAAVDNGGAQAASGGGGGGLPDVQLGVVPGAESGAVGRADDLEVVVGVAGGQ
ncbi:hypothetical protein [Paenarthrobacter sp. C1]|uniref:hypothetical protein n=1 Tax=Paenarthrobacter sp. C1 TaxID=3400220 RepID=UPI003BF5BED3